MKKLLFFLLLFLISPALAQSVNVYLFWAEGCPHCTAEKAFLESIKDEYNLTLNYFEVTGNQSSVELLRNVSDLFGVNVRGVPFTVIGEHYIVGYHDELTTGQEIISAINCLSNNGCVDVIAGLTQITSQDKTNLINLPLLGSVDPKIVSLPLVTVVLGFLDGFNPCAMWVLLFLISLLLGVKKQSKRIIYGSVFIISSAFVYFLFMTAWLNLFLFIGFVFWIRLLIGLIAFYAGYVNIKEFITKPSGCGVIGEGKRKAVFDKLKVYVQEKGFIPAVIGLFALAFVVNLVELVCSAGLPAVFTQILAINDLSLWQYYSYIILYILFFMFDDLIVFYIAMFTMKETGLSTKYGRWTRLVGGVLMFIIGVLMIFKPEWLMF